MLRRASLGLPRAADVRVCAHSNAPPRALSSRGGAARALAARVRCAALFEVSSLPIKAHCVSEIGPHPRCMAVLRRASRGLQRASGVNVCAHANAPARTHSWAEAQHARLRRARAALRWLQWAYALVKNTASARRPFPSVHGRAPTCQPRLQTSSRRLRVRTRKRATACTLSGGSAAPALAECARCAALVEVDPCYMKAHCASETVLSLGARPRSVLPDAASNEQSACACMQDKASPLSLSREEAHHAPLSQARAAPR